MLFALVMTHWLMVGLLIVDKQTCHLQNLIFRHLIEKHKEEKTDEPDIHWRPQALLCHPCRFGYSYVIKFENLAAESNRLLEYVQTHNLKTALPEKLRFPDKQKPATKNSLTHRTIKEIPEDLVEILRQIYADDFLLYDYDPFLYKGCTQTTKDCT